jgi:hypothetical protein
MYNCKTQEVVDSFRHERRRFHQQRAQETCSDFTLGWNGWDDMRVHIHDFLDVVDAKRAAITDEQLYKAMSLATPDLT